MFTEDEEGNIQIHYYNLFGNHVNWIKPGTKNPRPFFRTRLRSPIGEMKYNQPKGSGQYPYFTPGLIKKYHDETPIETLFLVEGEFKAYKGYMHRLDIVGLPSIHGFYSDENKGKLHEDLRELIIKCRVKKVYFLTDADTLSVKWGPDKDLSKRPTSFYSAIKNFRESLQLLLDDDKIALDNVYFGHIDSKYMVDAKGLDDLLIKFSDKINEIIEDLKQWQFANKYFNCQIITDPRLTKVWNYFGLESPEHFYQIYKQFIGNKEFLYKKRRYQWGGEELVFLLHEDAEKFMRIGPDWMKIIEVPDKYGNPQKEIRPWKKSEIISDYKRYPDFMDNIPKYDSFCNEPNWNGNYKRVHNNCYNLTEPLQHEPQEGEFPETKKFLKHIFSGNGDFDNNLTGDQFTVGLDYLCIQLQYPRQKLPVPILVSPENKTGKSTFFAWLKLVYGSNACILNNELFKMRFNSHYITKYIIAVDENFLEVDKKSEKERVKQLVTADTAFLENKGQNVISFPYYGKLIIGSNDAERVMKIEEGENRWFIVRVHPFPKEKEDPDLEAKLKDEIPAWLHFALNRQIHHPRKSRLWFEDEYFITEQFKIIVNETKGRTEKIIEDYVRELFLTYRITHIRVGMTLLLEKLNKDASKYRIDREDLGNYLKKRKKLNPHKHPISQNFPIGFKIDHSGNETDEVALIGGKQRCYHLFYKDWLNEDELLDEDGKPIHFTDTLTGVNFKNMEQEKAPF